MSSDTPPAAGAHSGNGFLRSRSPHAHSKVTFIELFFDLVFVFAVTQLSHLLMHHFSPAGALQTLLLMLAVWWVWIYTSWVTNWLDPERVPVRFLLLSIMLAGVVMSSALPMAFESRAVAFACAYTTIQVGRTAFFLRAVKGHVGLVRNFQRILAWLLLGGCSGSAELLRITLCGRRSGRWRLPWTMFRHPWASGFRDSGGQRRATGMSKAVIWRNGAPFL